MLRRTPTGTAFMRLITYGSHAVTSKSETADVCYLKPYYNDPNKNYFQQLAEGVL